MINEKASNEEETINEEASSGAETLNEEASNEKWDQLVGTRTRQEVKKWEEWEVKVDEEKKVAGEEKVKEEKDKCVICRCHQHVICKLRKCKKPGA